MAGSGSGRGGVGTRWVVDEASPTTLGALLHKIGADPDALRDGRVFVDRRRVELPGTVLRPGETVTVYAPPASTTPSVQVLARKDGVIAVAKPAGIPTVPDQHGKETSLQAIAARLLGLPDMHALHTTSRLDTEVSGVVLLAQGKRARDLLREAREKGLYRRHYVAVASKPPDPLRGWIEDPIGRGAQPNTRQIRGRDAVQARTHYACVAVAPAAALVAAEPATGRTHQIRVHLASRGAALLGDAKYGGPHKLVLPSGAVRPLRRIGLHAAWVRVQLGPRGAWEVQCPLPDDFLELWSLAGGGADALASALHPVDE